jgi:hypothetical protein
MHHINLDQRNNTCSTCCCDPISMRAGETRLVVLNYAPWTVPIMANGGGQGLVPTPQLSIVENDDACHNDAIDGVAAPSVIGDVFVTNTALAVSTDLTLDLKSDVTPADNTFEFTLAPVSGPYHGSLVDSPLSGEGWLYRPEQGYIGYDQFWVEIKDAQSRKIIRPINITVGAANYIPPKGWGEKAAMGLQIDRSKLRVNQAQQTVSFPLYLPPSNDAETIDACRRYRITVKAFARDCENEFSHITCLDVTSTRC